MFKEINRTGYSAKDRITYQAEFDQQLTKENVDQLIEKWIYENYHPMGYGSWQQSITIMENNNWLVTIKVWASTGD